MISLKAVRREGEIGIQVFRAGELVLATSDVNGAAKRLAALGVKKPEPLVAECLRYGAVDIDEEAMHP